MHYAVLDGVPEQRGTLRGKVTRLRKAWAAVNNKVSMLLVSCDKCATVVNVRC